MSGKVYLIPCPIGENAPEQVLPLDTIKIIHELDYYIVENDKTARQFLRAANHPKQIRELSFELLNKHTHPGDIDEFLTPVLKGKSVGIISEAGCPGVADPGASVVASAHRKNIQVVPLIGPSSILLAIMGSGFNGQSFAFVGYLPKDKTDLRKRTIEIEKLSRQFHQTQIFIETPFRNHQLLEQLVSICANNTKLSIAANLGQPNEIIISKPISQWKKDYKNVNINKIPTVFLILADD